jgi:hypothetical protein
MLVRRRRTALVALAATLLPWTTAAALSLHLTHDHSAPHADLVSVLHGHAHARGTPDHDHALAPVPTTTFGDSRVVFMTVLRVDPLAATGDPLAPMSLARSRPCETASPPASSRSSGSVLRI